MDSRCDVGSCVYQGTKFKEELDDCSAWDRKDLQDRLFLNTRLERFQSKKVKIWRPMSGG